LSAWGLLARQVRLRGWLRVTSDQPGPLVLLVTPLGMPIRRELAAALQQLGIQVRRRRPLSGWSDLSSALYARSASRRAARRSLAYVQAWRELADEYGQEAELWWLSPAEAHERLTAAKSALRRRLAPCSELRVRWREIRLHAFHVPDADRLGVELALLGIP